MTRRNILIITGPNLNKLGVREPSVYGTTTLKDIETMCLQTAKEKGLTLSFRQSNHEGEIVTWIQEALTDFDGVIINAAAYTHTSLAIADALKMLSVPIIEVHISNVFEREEFRHHSFISPIALGLICGFGAEGYVMALEAMAKKVSG